MFSGDSESCRNKKTVSRTWDGTFTNKALSVYEQAVERIGTLWAFISNKIHMQLHIFSFSELMMFK